jgi:hypothetical protein
MAPFTREVERHFGFLEAVGYEVLTNEASTSFDMGLALFRSAQMSIQVVRDRGDWSFEAGPLGGLRYADHLLAEAVRGSSAQHPAEVNHRDPAAVARHLEGMLPAIEGAFTPERSAQTVEALRRVGERRWEQIQARSKH